MPTGSLANRFAAGGSTPSRPTNPGKKMTRFGNLDGPFVFQTSAEDARYLVHELGEGIDENDIFNQGEHECYARLSSGQEPIPTVSAHLDPPPESNPAVASELAELSAENYGRDGRRGRASPARFRRQR